MDKRKRKVIRNNQQQQSSRTKKAGEISAEEIKLEKDSFSNSDEEEDDAEKEKTQKSITPTASTTSSSKPLPLKKQRFTCKICVPNREICAASNSCQKHNATYHIEYFFKGFKRPNLPVAGFKEYCEYLFKTEERSSLKIEISSENIMKCQCPFCPRQFLRNIDLRVHLCIHHKDNMVKKLRKLQKTKSLEEIRKVDLNDYSDLSENQLWKCFKCSKIFPEGLNLTIHRKYGCAMVPKEEKLKTCELCGEKMASTKMWKHKNFVCKFRPPEIMEKLKNMNPETLRKLEKYTPKATDVVRNFKCRFCEKRYTRQDILKTHQNSVHPGEEWIRQKKPKTEKRRRRPRQRKPSTSSEEEEEAEETEEEEESEEEEAQDNEEELSLDIKQEDVKVEVDEMKYIVPDPI